MIRNFLQFHLQNDDTLASREAGQTCKVSDSDPGFTLIGMIVAISVATMFMGGMFLDRGSFNSGVRLDSVTRDVALLVRQAQTYGAGGGSGIQLGQAHGVFLEDGNSDEIDLYADSTSTSGKYFNQSGGDKLIETLTLTDKYEITDFCLGSGLSDCQSQTTPNELSIYFVRPILDAKFHATSTSGNQAVIEITHKKSSSTEIIKVGSSGYISTPQ